jgi:two-component system, OmpR family, copper resistance phosphate regulon response regulator CusR
LKKILLIEDDPRVFAVIKKGLIEDGFYVDVAINGHEGLSFGLSGKYDLIILDVILPKLSGLEVCQKIRLHLNVPILVLSAMGTAEDVVDGFNNGADDYLVKPFKFIELIARINSLLRRSNKNTCLTLNDTFVFSKIELNNTSKIVRVDNKQLSLTSTEYKLLFLLMQTPKKIFSRQEILEGVWGINFELSTNLVDVYVNYLRKKLEQLNCPKLIHTVIGMGYVLRE